MLTQTVKLLSDESNATIVLFGPARGRARPGPSLSLSIEPFGPKPCTCPFKRFWENGKLSFTHTLMVDLSITTTMDGVPSATILPHPKDSMQRWLGFMFKDIDRGWGMVSGFSIYRKTPNPSSSSQ